MPRISANNSGPCAGARESLCRPAVLGDDAGLGDPEPTLTGAFGALCREYPASGLNGLVDGLKTGPLAHVAPDFRVFRIGALVFEAVSHRIALAVGGRAIKTGLCSP